MKKILYLIVVVLLLSSLGCGKYTPDTFKSDYYKDSAMKMKEDIDDITDARKL